MLVNESTGLDLNSVGVDLQGVDILWDVPQIVSVARIRYSNGTRLEIAYCPINAETEERNIALTMVPDCATRLRGYPSSTLGCGHEDEHTWAYWLFD
jgi:hypothetical protein